MVLHFALELGQNFDKRFNPDMPNLKTLLVKEKSCFALYTSIRSHLARLSASGFPKYIATEQYRDSVAISFCRGIVCLPNDFATNFMECFLVEKEQF